MYKHQSISSLLYSVAAIILWITQSPSLQATKPAIIKKAKASTVSIEVRTTLTAYTLPVTDTVLSGVVVNKSKGYILTIAHPFGPVSIGEYNVTFCNGEQAKARVLYYDLWQGALFLKVDPALMPNEVTSVVFSKKEPMIEQAVFTLSKGKNNLYTLHEGTISGLETVDLSMPQQSIIVSMDVEVSGTIGCVIWNKQGEALGLNCSFSKTSLLSLHGAYIKYALSFLENNERIPIRNHIGVVCADYCLDDAIRFDGFSVQKQKTYCKTFPKAHNKVLKVHSILRGSPAENLLMPGDILWAIDGKQVTCLLDLDMAMNTTEKNSIESTIFRKGSWHKVTILLYNIEMHKVRKMVHFGGATFFALDDVTSRLSGLPVGTVTFCAAHPTSIFVHAMGPYLSYQEGHFFCIQLLTLGDKKVATLEDIISWIPILIDKKYFTIDYINHLSYPHFSGYVVAHNQYKANITYHSNSVEPKSFNWDPECLEWNVDAILDKK